MTEKFLGFVEAESTTGEVLATMFIATQEEYGIMVAKMRTMECKQIRQQIHGAIYTHCKGHYANLAIVHASKESLVRSMMDTLQQIAVCFNYSAKRLRVLQAEQELDEDAKAGMNNRTKLQALCERGGPVVPTHCTHSNLPSQL